MITLHKRNWSSDSGVAGIMPQKHPFGFIFMNGKTGNDDEMNRTIAHELGHGLWGLDHVFDRAYGIQQGTTTNLMDYTDRTPSTYLAHFQWNLISKPSYNWSLFTGDEGNEAKKKQDVILILNGHYIVTGNKVTAKDANGVQTTLTKGIEVIALSAGKGSQKVKTLPDNNEFSTSANNLTKIETKSKPDLYYTTKEISTNVSVLPLHATTKKNYAKSTIIKHHATFEKNKYCIERNDDVSYSGAWIKKTDFEDFTRKVCDLPSNDKRKIGAKNLSADDFFMTPYGNEKYSGSLNFSNFTAGKEISVMASCGKYYLISGTKLDDKYRGAWVSREVLEFCVTKDDLEEIVGKSIDQSIVDAINKYCNKYEINTIERMSHFLGQGAHESGFKPICEDCRRTQNNVKGDFAKRVNTGTVSSVSGDKYKSLTNPDMLEGLTMEEIYYFKVSGNETKKDTIYKIPDKTNDGKLSDKDNVVKYAYADLNVKSNYTNGKDDCSDCDFFKYGYCCNKSSLGNKAFDTNDGNIFRGRGFIQLTGRDNYQRNFYTPWKKTHPEETRTIEQMAPLISTDPDVSVEVAMVFWKNKNINDVISSKSIDSTDDEIRQVSIKVNGGKEDKEKKKIAGYDDRETKTIKAYKTIK